MKTVLITGANKGIGYETAKQLAKLDYYVYIGSRDNTNGVEAVNKLRTLGIENVENIEIDVTNINSITSARQELERKIKKLDVLINNAGIAGEKPQNFSQCNIENLRKVYDTNFFGTVQTTQEFLELLKKSDEPRIVSISSGQASLSLHSEGQTKSGVYDIYSSSKAALNAFTIMLANEFKDTNFKINAIAPGYTSTDLNKFQGTQTVEQAAEIIVKYATIDNSGSTGKYFDKEGEIEW
ncbi:SDR family oxidoreductase [Pedobacter nototheniae]|uniref:SDR family oxidoreductase n=1 Tax=Pedobacter nototheniae TaxID=2488994 RepID=UPI002930DBC8|nr:SDR family oxidoreductase [Pedobacter nototheniae]